MDLVLKAFRAVLPIRLLVTTAAPVRARDRAQANRRASGASARLCVSNNTHQRCSTPRSVLKEREKNHNRNKLKEYAMIFHPPLHLYHMCHNHREHIKNRKHDHSKLTNNRNQRAVVDLFLQYTVYTQVESNSIRIAFA